MYDGHWAILPCKRNSTLIFPAQEDHTLNLKIPHINSPVHQKNAHLIQLLIHSI